jgi:hypothetical protein
MAASTAPETSRNTGHTADRVQALQMASRCTEIAAKLLAKHEWKSDRKPAVARAFGKALAVTSPRSEHGQLLAAALHPARWADRPPAERAVFQLARRGETPTEAAVGVWLDGVQRRRERGQQLRVAAAPFVENDAVRAAAHVAQVVNGTGAGPTWRELQSAMDWPGRPYGLYEVIITGIARGGWLEFTIKPRSLRPGHAARELTRGAR